MKHLKKMSEEATTRGITFDHSFSCNKVYNELRAKGRKVEWVEFVWNKDIIPKHRFITWMALQGRLNVRERVAKHTNVDTKCPLCERDVETIDHLLVQCAYTEEVWRGVESWVNTKVKGKNLVKQ